MEKTEESFTFLEEDFKPKIEKLESLVKKGTLALSDRIEEFKNSLSYELDSKFELLEGIIAEVSADFGVITAAVVAIEESL